MENGAPHVSPSDVSQPDVSQPDGGRPDVSHPDGGRPVVPAAEVPMGGGPRAGLPAAVPPAAVPPAAVPPAAVPPTAEAARAALEAVAESKALLVARMRRGPRWYNPVYGALCGLLVLSFGLPKPWFVGGVVLSAIGLGVLAGTYRKRTGIVLGAGNPRPRGIYPWLIAVLVVSGGASYLDGHHGFPLGVPLVAVVAGVACSVLSRRYDAALFALLESDDDGEARP